MICVLLKTLSPRVASNVLRTWAESNNSQPKSVLETDFDCGQTLHTACGLCGRMIKRRTGLGHRITMGRVWFKLFFLLKSVTWKWLVSLSHIGLSMATSHPMLRPMTAYNSKEHLNYAFNPLTNLKSQFSLSLLSNSAYCTVGNVLLNIVSSSHIEGEW